MTRIRRPASLLLVCTAIACTAPRAGSAQGASAASALAPAEFMVGCWRANGSDGTTVEESWSRPDGGMMLGWSRTLRPGRPTQFEHLRIEAVDGRLLYRPAPGGRPSEHDFRMTLASRGQIVFEAPEHDFPRRIIYNVLAEGALRARVDGGAASPEAQEWRMERVPCP